MIWDSLRLRLLWDQQLERLIWLVVCGSRIPEKNLNLKESEPDFKQTNKNKETNKKTAKQKFL